MVLEFNYVMFNFNQIYMNKKTSIKLNSCDIINIRKNLDIEITKSWRTIRNENIMSVKEIKAGLGSGKDLKALYNYITQLQTKRIKIKGILLYLNMGYSTFDFEEFKKTNYYHIFAACEAKETLAQLNLIPTLNPIEKAKKETFTSAKIAALKEEYKLKVNKHDVAMEKFNTETNINITSLEDEFKIELTT